LAVVSNLSTFQVAWLAGLLALWAGLLLGGFAFGRLNAERTSRTPTWARIASSLTLVVAAWSWYAVAHGTTVSAFAFLVALGMSLGVLGDLLLARLLPIPQHVVAGLGAFSLGHMAYISAILTFEIQIGLGAAPLRMGAWALWALAGLAGWYYVVLRGQKPAFLHWAALPYSLLLASTAGLACGLALRALAFVPLAIGAALFLLSDLILAARLFRGMTFPLIEDLIWLTYGPAQMLIVYTVAAALRLS
jgi:hypothetical protein